MKYMSAVMVMMFIFNSVGMSFAGGGGMSGGALEVTQNINRGFLSSQVAESIRQTHQQIQMVQNQIDAITREIHNTAMIPRRALIPVATVYQSLRRIHERSMGIVYTLSNYDQELKRIFKDATDLEGLLRDGQAQAFKLEMEGIARANRETTRSVLELLGLAGRRIESEEDVLAEINNIAQDAEGRNALLDAANQYAAFQSEQLLRVHNSFVSFASMMGIQIESQNARDDLQQAQWERATRAAPMVVPQWTVNEFGY